MQTCTAFMECEMMVCNCWAAVALCNRRSISVETVYALYDESFGVHSLHPDPGQNLSPSVIHSMVLQASRIESLRSFSLDTRRAMHGWQPQHHLLADLAVATTCLQHNLCCHRFSNDCGNPCPLPNSRPHSAPTFDGLLCGLV